jgi:cytochrome d ubiquinol oxidase subunit II
MLALLIWRAIPLPPDGKPFLYSLALALLAYAGLGISLWPYAIPESVTLWQAAGSSDTLIFVGVGTAIILPLTLGYLGYAHWVFRGKAHGGYEH